MRQKRQIARNRDLLESLIGTEGWFTATVQRYGTYEDEVNLSLCNVKTDGRQPLADHVWVPACEALIEAQVRKGDCIEFHAKVVSYITGFGRNDVPHCSATFAEIRDVKKLMQKGLYY